MDIFVPRNNNGDLGLAAIWTDVTTGQSPASSAPGPADEALFATSGNYSGTDRVGSLVVASGFSGGWTMSGQIDAGTATIGDPAVSVAVSPALQSATTATVSGAAATLRVEGTLTVGDAAGPSAVTTILTGLSGATLQAGAGVLFANGALRFDATSGVVFGPVTSGVISLPVVYFTTAPFGSSLTNVYIEADASLSTHGGFIGGVGTRYALISDQGTLSNDGALTIQGSLSGSGVVSLAGGMTNIQGSIGGVTIDFASPTAGLQIGGLSSFVQVKGFAAGDTIDFTNNGHVTLGGGGTGVLAFYSNIVMNLGTAPSGMAFNVTSDGSGGSLIGLQQTGVQVGSLLAGLPPGSLSGAATAAATAALAPFAKTDGTVVVDQNNASFGIEQGVSPDIDLLTGPAAGQTLAPQSLHHALIISGGGAVSLSDSAATGVLLIGNAAGDTFMSGGMGAVLVGGQGNNTFQIAGTAAVTTGDGTNLVQGSGTAQLAVTTGTGTNQIAFAGGGGTLQSNGTDTAVGGSGAVTVNGNAGQLVAFAGSGGLTYTGGSGAAIVVGLGGNPIHVTGGTGAGQYFGSGGSTIVAGTGGPGILVGANGDQLFSKGAAGDLFAAGPGDLLMSGMGSVGNDVFFGSAGTGTLTFLCGSGNDILGLGQGTNLVTLGSGHSTVFGPATPAATSTITLGSGSADIALGGQSTSIVIAAAAAASRTAILFNYVPGADKISLSGFSAGEVARAIAGQSVAGGLTIVTLSDRTVIDLVNAGRVDSSLFA